mmetsp:Transcript_70246/g.139141  ORF Transcript_70246/g.139141 Transcript_70246/m.139141 type:complete len:430 (+) Transcript_70246:694-1983(+)
MHSVTRLADSSGTGAFKSLQPNARVTRTGSAASVGAQIVVARTTVSTATSKVLRALSTSRGHTDCKWLRELWNLLSEARFACFAPHPSSTLSSCAATAGSETKRPVSLALSICARRRDAPASVVSIASTALAADSSFAKTATACCRKSVPTLSGCTTSDRFRNVLRIAAAPSARSAGATPSTAKGFAARATCSNSRSRSSSIEASLLGLALHDESSKPMLSHLLGSHMRPPADSTRSRSSVLAPVWASPPMTIRTPHEELAEVAARWRFCDATGAGPQTTHRIPPTAPMTKRVPMSRPTARLQPERHAAESSSMPSRASTASRSTSMSSKSSHSVALAESLGKSSTCNFFAQNSAANEELRRPSQSTIRDAGRSRNSSGCFSRKPVLCKSCKITAIQSFLPSCFDDRLALPRRTLMGKSRGLCGVPVWM